MPNAWFRFKQFTVRQDRCAMKVGTDGVLLGAWACAGNPRRILDIGTGTGVLALIAAQRFPQALIDAVELDPDAAQQAAENATESPWAVRIAVHHADIRRWTTDQRYELILCNPPFYQGHRASRNDRMAAAKHEGGLGLGDLLEAIARLGAPGGKACVVLPLERLDQLKELAAGHGLSPSRLCVVRHLWNKPPKRALVELSHSGAATIDELVVQFATGEFAPAYKALLNDLELHF